MMARSLLYLAYFFPPRGGAGVQRSVKFAKYLPEFGWKPLVVANGGTNVDSASNVQDPTLLKDLPADAVVRYTTLTAAEKSAYERSQSKWRQRLYATDPMGWWCGPAVRLGMELVAEHNPDAILVTMSPFTSARAGLELKKRTGLPLVFDLRDPWALDETRLYPTRWHARRDWRAMRDALCGADLVVMNTPESALAVVEEFGPDLRGKVIAITNGYDAADFAKGDFEKGVRPLFQNGDSPLFRIVHTGMFHSEWAPLWDDVLAGRGLMNKLKYPRRPINLWTRTPRYLLDAIARATQTGRIPADKIELILAGEISDADRRMVQQSPIAHRVSMPGYMKHRESTALLESADLLFLPLHTPIDGGPALIVPGKCYEYLGSGRPILAMGPRGDMRTFVESTHSGIAIDGDDVDGATSVLVHFYHQSQSGVAPAQDRAAVERFERRHLTARLAEALQQVIAGPNPL